MKDSSQAPEQNDWKEFKPLFGGGKIKLCDTLRAVTPFGGLSGFDRVFRSDRLGRAVGEPTVLSARKSQSLRSGPGSGWIYVERHCRSAAFRACQPAKGRSSFACAAGHEALSKRQHDFELFSA